MSEVPLLNPLSYINEHFNWAALAFTINYIFGAGVLGIPSAFVNAGLICSGIFLIFISILSASGLVWEVEAISRRQVLERNTKIFDDVDDYSESVLYQNISLQNHDIPIRDDFIIQNYDGTITDLCQFYWGEKGRKGYLIAIFLYITSSMWFYAVIFGVSLGSAIPLPNLNYDGGDTRDCSLDEDSVWDLTTDCRIAYSLFVTLFAIISLYTVTLEIGNQSKLQMILSSFGIFTIIIMIITVIIALSEERYEDTGHRNDSHLSDVPLWIDFNGFGQAFTSFVFAQLAHHGVPTLVHVLNGSINAKKIFTVALTTTCITYAFLGVTCALFFGDGVDSLITLNWKDYTASVDDDDDHNIFAQIISVLVRLFPVMTVTAAYPLNAISLGDTLYQLLPNYIKEEYSERFTRILSRWIVCIPSLVGALILNNVKTLIAACGICGFFLAFIIPGLLQLKSSQLMKERFNGIWLTPYSWSLSNLNLAWLAIIFGLFSVFFVITWDIVSSLT